MYDIHNIFGIPKSLDFLYDKYRETFNIPIQFYNI